MNLTHKYQIFVTYDCPEGNVAVNINPLDVEVHKSASQWKSAVQDKRQQIFEECNQNIPSKSHKHGKQYSDPNENNVIVVDQSYFIYNFKWIVHMCTVPAAL